MASSVDAQMAEQGIPKAEVVEDVADYLKSKNQSLEDAQRFIEDRYHKYKTVENSMNERRARLVSNLPDFNRALEHIKLCREAKIKGKDSLTTLSKLEENSYQRFRITNLDKVTLLLGCNTFAEFTLDEAEKLLTDNVSGIERVLGQLRSELDWLRDQITTSEVSIAHLHNYNIRQKSEKS
ncbi:Prefoldin subunit 3 [Aphelenchoides bicaudatus]|nr:Prefoldin subunit 3 [Aphelenchoides bicaudatus]